MFPEAVPKGSVTSETGRGRELWEEKETRVFSHFFGCTDNSFHRCER